MFLSQYPCVVKGLIPNEALCEIIPAIFCRKDPFPNYVISIEIHPKNNLSLGMMCNSFPKRALPLATNGIALGVCMLWDFPTHRVEAKVVTR